MFFKIFVDAVKTQLNKVKSCLLGKNYVIFKIKKIFCASFVLAVFRHLCFLVIYI